MSTASRTSRTQRLFQVAIDGRPAREFPSLRTAVARPTNLREDLRPLVGRTAELARLQALLDGDARLVTVVGAGGAGKTRLALAAARRMLDDMPGGVFVVALASVGDAAALLDAVTLAMDLRGLNDDPMARIAGSVTGRPTLLVLDNFEHLLAAAPIVGELLAEAPELKLLVTSQAALDIGGETVVGLDALELDAAVELFERFAQRGGALSDRDEERDALRELCRRVGCLPLAIELAAARTSVLAPSELLQRLERSSEVLSGGRRDAPERQRSLRAMFDWTHGLLAPAERVLFRRLGAFAGPVALDPIETICEIPTDEPPLSALDSLDGLLRFSLVTRDESTAYGRRFTMPEALREFARRELARVGDAPLVRLRHAEHLAAVAGESRIWFSASPAARARLLALQAEIRPALAWAADADADLYRRLVAVLALGMVRRGQVRDAIEHATRARAASEAPADDVDAWTRNCLAYGLLAGGRLHEAESAIGPVIAYYRERGDARHLGLALNTAGWVALGGDLQRALEIAQESFELLGASGDRALADRGLILLIQVLLDTGALDDASRLLDQAAAATTDPQSEMTNAVATLRGDAAIAGGDAAAALVHYAESLRIAVMRADGIQTITDAYCVAFALARAGRPEGAVEAAAITAAIAADAGHANRFPDIDAAIEDARAAVGPVAAQLTARGHGLPAGQRVARVLALADAAS